MLEVAVATILTPLISELLTPIAQQVGSKIGETLGDKSQKWLDFLIPEPKKKPSEDTALVEQAQQQYQQVLLKYAHAKDARDRELFNLTLAQGERRLQLQEQERQDRLQLGALQRELMRELQAKELEVKREEITNSWDKDKWFSNLSRQETEQILQQQQHRLLILLSPPEISADAPASFRNNLKTEMRSIGTFLSQHYPQQDKLRPVKFYSDYFTQPIADIDVERLQRILAPIPTAILYSDISDYAITFRVGFWGMQNREVSLFSTKPLNWEQAKEALLAAGQNETQALRAIRQVTVTIHKLLAAFLADLYYLNIDPNYEPQLLNLVTEFALDGLAQGLMQPYLDILQQIQQRQLVAYEQELKRLVAGGFTGRCKQPTTFEFQVATVDSRGKIISNRRCQSQLFVDDLGGGVNLEMVAIPGGTFWMGSPDHEKERQSSESPRHSVTVAPFYMGKFPITQAQWRAVAALPQVNSPLKHDPSGFKGANLPVEQVSWYDTVEFFARLNQKTGKDYRLPSEAEWEYACRAGTTTPFHFGETITPEIVNCNGNYSYGAAAKGEYRGKTTPVGIFQVANAFGLYDLHGNGWEWCADTWHENYLNAPTDGSIWLSSDDSFRVLRGGSWSGNPGACRSAFRLSGNPGNGYYGSGFRAVFSVE